MQMVFSKVHPACRSIVNGIKPGSNSKKTDKHAADCSKAVCWGRKVIYVRCIVRTTMWPKVSVSLTKKQFLFIQENFHASKSFWKIYLLKLNAETGHKKHVISKISSGWSFQVS